jgi:hypothetical protein
MNRYDKKMQELGGQFYGASRGESPITLTDDDLAEVDHELGYQLPADYREFLRNYGGYDVSPDFRFPFKQAVGERMQGCASHFMAVSEPTRRMAQSTDLLLNYRNMCASEWQLSSFSGLTMIRPVADRSRFVERIVDLGAIKTIRLADPDSGWFEDEYGELYLPWPPELLPIASLPGHAVVCLSVDKQYTGSIFYLQTIPFFAPNFYLVADSFDEFMQSATLLT